MSLLVLAACSERMPLEPAGPASRAKVAATPDGTAARASVVVTDNYSVFDARAEFDGAGVIDHLNRFDEFSGSPVYPLPNPWTAEGVTYTSGSNQIVGPLAGLGIVSNAISYADWTPMTGELAASDAFTMFGVDLTTVVRKDPIDIVLYTNLGSYAFDDLAVPLSSEGGHRFFGIALTRPGEYLTRFRVSSNGAGSGPLLDNIAVGHVGRANTAPEASAGGPYTGTEGSPVTFAVSASDADGDALTFAWDLGDGTTGTGLVPPASHVYADDGAYDVTLVVSDDRGAADTAHAVVNVANVAPSLAAFSLPATPLALAPGGITVPVSTAFADPGTLDTHSAALDCGTGVVVESPVPDGTVGGVCSFSSPGVYSVQVTVSDDDGGIDTKAASGQIVVYDPAAGWITGGGWIASPAGAYAPAPAVAGKLTFGFVARYQSSTTPDGNAEFKLALGKLDFRSTALDWLVVTDAKARLEGRGTMNGEDGYAFMLTAMDGASVDAVRIRIWKLATGEVVYDSRPDMGSDPNAGTTLGGGSIQVHAQ